MKNGENHTKLWLPKRKEKKEEAEGSGEKQLISLSFIY